MWSVDTTWAARTARWYAGFVSQYAKQAWVLEDGQGVAGREREKFLRVFD